ncbi:MAG: hypothetical protein ABR949_15500 [Candidatus Aquilonibacter sp.]|jgi:hypothetical protein
MKDENALALLIGGLIAVAAVERFYQHPTYGTGWRALFAVLQFGLDF